MTEGDKALVEKLGLLVNSDHVETFSQQTLTRIGVLAQKKATSHDASEDYDILQMLMETLLKISQTETGKVALAQHKGILRGLLEGEDTASRVMGGRSLSYVARNLSVIHGWVKIAPKDSMESLK